MAVRVRLEPPNRLSPLRSVLFFPARYLRARDRRRLGPARRGRRTRGAFCRASRLHAHARRTLRVARTAPHADGGNRVFLHDLRESPAGVPRPGAWLARMRRRAGRQGGTGVRHQRLTDTQLVSASRTRPAMAGGRSSPSAACCAAGLSLRQVFLRISTNFSRG